MPELYELDVQLTPSFSVDEMRENISLNMGRGLSESLPEGQIGAVQIVGGGPTLKETWQDIDPDIPIIALNGAAKFLQEKGRLPYYHIIMDSSPENVAFVQSADLLTHYFINARVDPPVLDALDGFKVSLWYSDGDAERKMGLQAHKRLLHGGSTVAISAFSMAFFLGFREFHFFGVDSCVYGDEIYVYDKPWHVEKKMREVYCGDRKFMAESWMGGQVRDFLTFLKFFHENGFDVSDVHVHGDSLTAQACHEYQRAVSEWSAESIGQRAAREYLRIKGLKKSPRVAAYYDLSKSPASYDFLTFLTLARATVAPGGHLDVHFVPGPNDGFRDSVLPPNDTAMHQRMFDNICIPACRLFPNTRAASYGNLDLNIRPTDGSQVFPDGYTSENRIRFYSYTNISRLVAADEPIPSIVPSKALMDEIRAKYADKRIVTITLRNAPYHPDRNSDLQSWSKFSHWLIDEGYHPVMIPDAWTPAASGVRASNDLEYRAALYEVAECNMGINGGAMTLASWNCRTRYANMKTRVDSCSSTTAEWFEQFGMRDGDSWPHAMPAQRMIWKDDTLENIIETFESVMAQPKVEGTEFPSINSRAVLGGQTDPHGAGDVRTPFPRLNPSCVD